MPGRLRKRDTLSDKAQGCCNKCCETFCRLSPWNQMLCVSAVVVLLAGLTIFMGGAFLASAANNPPSPPVCTSNGSEPRLPVVDKNLYVWYLSSSGILVIVMLFGSCLCCGAFFGLCCGDFGKAARICSIITFIVFAIAFLLFLIWVGTGTYLLSTFSLSRSFSSVCRNIFVYLVLMYIYLFVFVVLCVLSCVWKIHSVAKGETQPYTKANVV